MAKVSFNNDGSRSYIIVSDAETLSTRKTSIHCVSSECVGDISGKSEVYVYFKDANKVPHIVARFKYRKAKSSAKDWVKFILKHMTAAQVVEALKDGKETPIGLAERFGYVSLNVRELKKLSNNK